MTAARGNSQAPPRGFTNLLYHVVFSARNRMPCIDAELKDRLFAYLGGIVRELGAHALKVGGAADHVHLFVAVPPTVALADLMRVVKSGMNGSRRDSAPVSYGLLRP